jgi:hypothetical protein
MLIFQEDTDQSLELSYFISYYNKVIIVPARRAGC